LPAAKRDELYTLVIEVGVLPAVFVSQKDGKELEFALKDAGKYVFVLKNGQIVNAFK
jgi:hypothetical protein